MWDDGLFVRYTKRGGLLVGQIVSKNMWDFKRKDVVQRCVDYKLWGDNMAA
jgi:hypothetical protein